MNTAERDIAWRYSFNEAEKVLLLDSQAPIANNCRRPVLRILKSLQKDYKWAGIRSYHLKTVLLHEFESHHPRDWTSDNMFQCLKKALERLRDFLQSKKCPHYFLPGINLFKTLSEQHRTKIIRDIKNFFDYPKGALEKLNGKASTGNIILLVSTLSCYYLLFPICTKIHVLEISLSSSSFLVIEYRHCSTSRQSHS